MLLTVCVAGWLLFQHIPAWYEPVEIAPERVQAVRDDLVHTFDTLSEALNETSEPFTCRLTADQINAWLATREEIWPQSRKWLPSFISSPHVAMTEDGLQVAVAFRQRGVRTILNAHLRVRADEEGIHVQLKRVAGGSLPLPPSWVREQLARVDEARYPAGQTVDGQLGGRTFPYLQNLFDGVVFPGAWLWANGKQPFRVRGLSFGDGFVEIRMEPLERFELHDGHETGRAGPVRELICPTPPSAGSGPRPGIRPRAT